MRNCKKNNLVTFLCLYLLLNFLHHEKTLEVTIFGGNLKQLDPDFRLDTDSVRYFRFVYGTGKAFIGFTFSY